MIAINAEENAGTKLSVSLVFVCFSVFYLFLFVCWLVGWLVFFGKQSVSRGDILI